MSPEATFLVCSPERNLMLYLLCGFLIHLRMRIISNQFGVAYMYDVL